MRISVKYAYWLLPLLALPVLVGCDRKTQAAQTQALAPPIVDAPPPKPAAVSPSDLPPPVVGNPQQASSSAPDLSAKPPEPPKKAVRRLKKTAPPASTETASAAPPSAPAPSVSAIGELSQGASGDLRSQTEENINSTEKGVNGISRSLNDSETKTAAQIHEFLKQAREALTSGDVDGAQTLVKKAKVLLAELEQ